MGILEVIIIIAVLGVILYPRDDTPTQVTDHIEQNRKNYNKYNLFKE